jgi:hypothetical protein
VRRISARMPRKRQGARLPRPPGVNKNVPPPLAEREKVRKTGARADVAYSEALGAEIARRVAAGENLLAVCAERKIARAILFTWAAEHPDFAEQMDRAIAISRQTLRERMSAIASAEIGFSTGDTSRDRLQIEDIERQLAAVPMYFGKGPAPDEAAEPVSYSDLKLLLFLIAEGDPSLTKRLERHIGPRPTATPLNDALTGRVSMRETSWPRSEAAKTSPQRPIERPSCAISPLPMSKASEVARCRRSSAGDPADGHDRAVS